MIWMENKSLYNRKLEGCVRVSTYNTRYKYTRKSVPLLRILQRLQNLRVSLLVLKQAQTAGCRDEVHGTEQSNITCECVCMYIYMCVYV